MSKGRYFAVGLGVCSEEQTIRESAGPDHYIRVQGDLNTNTVNNTTVHTTEIRVNQPSDRWWSAGDWCM